VGNVSVDRLVEREKSLARNDSAIYGRVEIRDACPNEARDELGDILTDTVSADIAGFPGPLPYQNPRGAVSIVARCIG
jgi:hypothetical protein